jgi:hypothetical protein
MRGWRAIRVACTAALVLCALVMVCPVAQACTTVLVTPGSAPVLHDPVNAES